MCYALLSPFELNLRLHVRFAHCRPSERTGAIQKNRKQPLDEGRQILPIGCSTFFWIGSAPGPSSPVLLPALPVLFPWEPRRAEG